MSREYEDGAGASGAAPGPLDGFFRDQFVLCIIITVCCGIVGLVLNLICFFTAKDPVAKKNATVCLIINAVFFVLGCIAGIIQVIIGLTASAGAVKHF